MSNVDKIKNKNVFAKNRIKDIHMIQELKKSYNVSINFKYIPGSENPADLLSRGLKFDKFKENLMFWLHGPNWLSEYHVQFFKL